MLIRSFFSLSTNLSDLFQNNCGRRGAEKGVMVHD